MTELIAKIIHGKEIEHIFKYVLKELFADGPTSITTLEILSYLYVYQNDEFKKYNDSILKYMGTNYKKSPTKTLADVIFGMYHKHILDTYGYEYTPVQASIIQGIQSNKNYSFSAPTSTGKSFVFRNIIEASTRDVVIIVPSRALINEYFLNINEAIPDKNVNILTFIDKVNTKYAKRNIFIVTPERCRELIKGNL